MPVPALLTTAAGIANTFFSILEVVNVSLEQVVALQERAKEEGRELNGDDFADLLRGVRQADENLNQAIAEARALENDNAKPEKDPEDFEEVPPPSTVGFGGQEL